MSPLNTGFTVFTCMTQMVHIKHKLKHVRTGEPGQHGFIYSIVIQESKGHVGSCLMIE